MAMAEGGSGGGMAANKVKVTSPRQGFRFDSKGVGCMTEGDDSITPRLRESSFESTKDQHHPFHPKHTRSLSSLFSLGPYRAPDIPHTPANPVDAAEMIVDILPFRLQLASLGKTDIPRCTHQLMKLVLFPKGPRHFFSYTETDKEVSLILDESHIGGFPKGALNVCNVVWRAVQIEPGESGLGAEDVVSQVSRPLADINVSIMQISTYDADFTLMPECDLQRALECLSSKFSITNNPLEDLGLQVSDLKSWEASYPTSPKAISSLQDALLLDPSTRERQASLSGDSGIASSESSRPNSDLADAQQDPDPSAMATLTLGDAEQSAEDCSRTKTTRHPFNANYPHRLHITSMEESHVDMLAIKLLEIDRFFSFTQTDTTLSIIMDDATMSLFPDHTLNTHAGDWRLIAIGDGPLGFNECGIVSEFSRPLSENGISLFYLSTFSSDYIMVNDQDFEQAVARLHLTAQTSIVGVTRPDVTLAYDVRDDRSIRSSGSGTDNESDTESDVDSASEVDPEDYEGGGKDDDGLEIVFEDDSIRK
ncbi:Cytosolic arginine sensor for mTORC1 subunit 2 [Gamsiella multidivaricata]|nr:Cytosolic arginine sensor for mTORC1 subunit 2 [Gamsiella multidivaricata]